MKILSNINLKRAVLLGTLLCMCTTTMAISPNKGWKSDEENGGEKKSRKIERVNSELEKISFVNKGTVILGGKLSYTSLHSSDYTFLLFDDATVQAELIGGEIMTGYAISDNVVVGLGFDYSRNNFIIDNVSMNLGDDLNFAIEEYTNIQQIYTATAFLRNYVSLGKSRRFAFFNDVKVYFGGGQGKYTSGATSSGDAYVGSYEKINNLGLVVQPGVTAFVTNSLALEVSIGVFGLEYSRTEQITNQVYQGVVETFSASFKLNLLSVDLGLTFYF